MMRFPFRTLVFLSGAAALIYEIVWHRYLTILLGAQSLAAVITLSVFFAGLGIGYAFWGRFSRRPLRLLRWFAGIEIAMGIWGIFFPNLFRLLFQSAPLLYAKSGVDSLTLDFAVATLLLGIPTFLMGGTLPLLTQALSDDVRTSSTRHAQIYGWNTLGAFSGCVAATYLLIPYLSLAQNCVLAGVLNISVGLFSYFSPLSRVASRIYTQEEAAMERAPLPLLLTAFFSGFYILTLQTVLGRIAGLSLGSSGNLFGIVTGIFVLSIGLGSLRVSKSREGSLLRNQLGIGVSLVLLYLIADWAPYGGHVLRILFRDIPENFVPYQIALGGALLVVLILPVGLAGATLPLCFQAAKKKAGNLGLRVGEIYFVNTVGCILGAVLGGYVFLNYLNLDQVFKIAIGTVFLSGALVALSVSRAGVALAVAGLCGVALLPGHDKRAYAQPFRISSPIASSFQGAAAFTDFIFSKSRYLVYRDGPDGSIGIAAHFKNGVETSRTVYVNGKSDGNTEGDTFTMKATGHLPALFSRDLKDAMVIGFGTGVTLGALKNYPTLQKVDVAEISKTLLQHKQEFDPYNGGVSRDSRFRYHAMDAFRFLYGTDHRYDIVISEPSNPWVVGVENLYTKEFYEITRRHLKKDGILAQWLQGYSFDEDLFRNVLSTITSIYPSVSVFQLREYDLLILASDRPIDGHDIARMAERAAGNEDVRRDLATIGIQRPETLLALEAISPRVARALSAGGESYSLESPRLSHGANKAFFAKRLVDVQSTARSPKEYFQSIPEFLVSRLPLSNEALADMQATFCHHASAYNWALCRRTLLRELVSVPGFQISEEYQHLVSTKDVRQLRQYMAGEGAPQGLFEFYQREFSPIVALPLVPVSVALENCLLKEAIDSKAYGDCLLQLVGVGEIDGTFAQTAQRFSKWLDGYEVGKPGYESFKEAERFLRLLSSATQSR